MITSTVLILPYLQLKQHETLSDIITVLKTYTTHIFLTSLYRIVYVT